MSERYAILTPHGWHGRTLDGYGAGVPARLAVLLDDPGTAEFIAEKYGYLGWKIVNTGGEVVSQDRSM